MKGLFDLLNSDDPAVRQGLLQAGLSLLGSKGNFGNALGQAGMAGLLGSQQFRDRQSQQERQKMSDQLMQGQIGNMQREQQIAKLPMQFYRPPSAPAVDATGGMETAAENPANASGPGGFDMSGYADALAQFNPVQALQLREALKKQEPKIQEFDPTKSYGTVQNGKITELRPAQPKPDDLPSAVREYQFAKSQGYPGSFEQWTTSQKKAGASSVSVNTGQKGYENESKLRNDFKSEPIYKDFQDMQAAHKQIKAGIAQGTPIGDVATATKIMKLLDPGSVVRESELGIAMAAGGRMDRLQNYVQMQISGEKLTPKMREDFGKLADELYAASAQAYNKKRGEYETMGQRYQLDPSVLGAPAKVDSVGRGGMPSMSAIDAELARRKEK